jgi:hypothetical protein
VDCRATFKVDAAGISESLYDHVIADRRAAWPAGRV